MKVCYYGAYDAEYARNIVILNSLKKTGVEIIECNDRSHILKRTFRLLYKAIFLDFDAILVGYPGHLDVFSARILSILRRKPLIFDAFISVYNAEREYGNIKQRTVKAKYCYWLDKWSCKLAYKVLLDTDQHIDYFCRKFGLDKEKFKRIFIGADETLFFPRKIKKKEDIFLVLYYGRTTPLHGLDFIIKAAKMLEKQKDIKFLLIGGNIHFRLLRKKYKNRVNIKFIDEILPKEVPEYIARADICLGIFGCTEKAEIVIPNKAYEALAMKKPLLTGDSAAARSVLTNEKDAILCEMASSKAIAESILLLKTDEKLRKKIAENGYKLFKERFTSAMIGKEVKKTLLELM